MKSYRKTWPEKLVYLASMLLTKTINRNKDIQAFVPKHILCIRQDEIGDMCYTLHVFTMLKQQFPDAKITLLCKPSAITLLNNNPAITHLTSNFGDLIHKYDLIIDLRGTWRSIVFSITHWPPFRLDRATIRFANSQAGKHPHEVITNLQVVESIIDEHNRNISPHIYTGKTDQKKAEDFLIDHNIGAFALLHIGARRALRKWNQYEQLATYLKREKKLNIVFTGDKSEIKEIKQLQSKLPFETYSTAGFFNLTELSALASLCTLYVGNESGPLHIAAVSGAKCIGLYGPGEPFVFYPWGTQSAVLHHVLDCNPCDQIHCVHPDNPCINRIALAEVIEKVETLLS
ncbi:MAG: glycosyltransferase family 9 protein [Bacteroidota bacterium]